VQDYVNKLYAPAALSSRELGEDKLVAARELATWKARLRGAWHAVRVDHVEADGGADGASVGDTVSVRAFISLGELEASDVEVQLVYGRVDESDQLTATSTIPLDVAEVYEGGRMRYEGSVALERSGPFGYTVRVLPAHRLLAGPAELGLIATPAGPTGMTDGHLR
jgi:starch phosphorylase